MASKDKDDLSLAPGSWLPSTLPLLLCKSPSPPESFAVWCFQHILLHGAVLFIGCPVFYACKLCAHCRGNSEGMYFAFTAITDSSGYGTRAHLHSFCFSRCESSAPALLLPLCKYIYVTDGFHGSVQQRIPRHIRDLTVLL